jgi:hypothetical protein
VTDPDDIHLRTRDPYAHDPRLLRWIVVGIAAFWVAVILTARACA